MRLPGQVHLCKLQAILADNGPEGTSAKFVSWAEQHGIALRIIQQGEPNQNAFVQRFNRSVRQEVLNAQLFDSLAEAQQTLGDWRIEYNTVRSHESLGKKTPLAYLPRVGAYKLFCVNTGGAFIGDRVGDHQI